MRNLLGWTGAIVLFGSLATSATAKNNFNCMIVDEAGKPIEKGEMVLVAVAGGKENKRKTNDKGQVEFKGLDDGAYQIQGNIDGYIFSKSAPMEIAGNITKPCSYTLISATHANAILQEVLMLLQQKKVADAESKAMKAVELMPEESGAHYVLAVAHATGGKETEALTSIKRAAELSPEKFGDKVQIVHMSAISVQADQFMAKNDFDGAIRKYEEMIKVNPSEPIAYYNMAVAYGRANKLNEALTAIDKAIALKPGDAEIAQMKTRLQDMFLKSIDTELKAP
jgi:tetratricopeptide (TPR) repeat protein